MPTITVLCGGVGAARLLTGMVQTVPARDLTAVANIGDDTVLHGLHISPDLDTIVYTLAGAVSAERGWGLEGETWRAMEMLQRYGGQSWFSLGDTDLATHLFRTEELRRGKSLSEVTAAIATTWGLEFQLLPVSDDPVSTTITVGQPESGSLPEGVVAGDQLGFQQYFVRYRHDLPVADVTFVGADQAAVTPAAMRAVTEADLVVIAPSNPVVSIDPLLAIGQLRKTLIDRKESVVAVSPIVGGKALKGPADRLLVDRGGVASATGVAEWYRDVIGTLVIDTVDADQVPAIEALGISAAVTDTVMSDPAIAAQLCRFIVDLEP